MTKPGRSRGFTFIEMVVTVAIVALLATMAFPVAELAIKRSKERDLRDALRQIRTAIDAYKAAADEKRIIVDAQASGYPPSLRVLEEGVEDAKSPNRDKRIYFIRRLPRDPMSPNQAGPAEATWGRRSYASPPDAPAEGADIFDVYSRSTAIGLNGVPYSKW